MTPIPLIPESGKGDPQLVAGSAGEVNQVLVHHQPLIVATLQVT